MCPILLQKATAILLQNATNIYYKMRQILYYKFPQLLQNATFIKKMRQYTIQSDFKEFTTRLTHLEMLKTSMEI